MSRKKKSFLKRYVDGLFLLRNECTVDDRKSVATPGDISGNIEYDGEQILSRFKNDSLFKFKDFVGDGESPIKGKVFFFDGMANDAMIASDYLRPISKYKGEEKSIEHIAANVVYGNDLKLVDTIDDVITGILAGNAAFIFEGELRAIVADTKLLKVRSVTEPENEKVLKGSHEGFIEDIIGNVGLIKKRIQTHKLKAEFITVGRNTNTQVAVCYLEGVCNDKLVKNIKERISEIDIDGVLDTNYLTELISDFPYSPFPVVGSTERPDSAAGKLLEGRIVVIVNGSPEVITLPYMFIENFQSPEDYYVSYIYATFVRFLRMAAFSITVFLPGIFVALVSYHTQIIPIELLVSIIATREGVPFPTVLECALLILIFEIIREAGIRVPAGVSQPLSIVGAIVLGDAAVTARLVSSTMVIVVAMTALCGLMNTRLKSATIVFRMGILFLGSLLGLYGVLIGFLLICATVLNLESFGVRYTDKSFFEDHQASKDSLVRTLWPRMITRPESISSNSVRQQRSGR